MRAEKNTKERYFLVSLVSLVSLLCADTVHAKTRTICTGDVSAHQIAVDVGLSISKACISENKEQVEMSVVIAGRPISLNGVTRKHLVGNDLVYTNIRDADGAKKRTTIRMKSKDRIRSEGAMADHFIGSLEIAERQEKTSKFKVSSHLDGLHFYTGTPNHEIHWGYHEKTGPENWGELRPEWEACLTGNRQSPVQLSSEQASVISAEPLQFDYRDVTASLVNNGHALQVNVAEGSSFMVGGKRYKLLQFHAHTPSEHFLDGKEYPMEIHLVHQAEDKSFAVVGVFVETPAGAPADLGLEAALREFPTAINDPKEFSRKVNPERWMPATDKRGYFNYPGSLTTPPCSEGVSWYVMREPIKVSQDQVEHVKQLIGGENARHLPGGTLLPLEGRVIRYSPN
jgi:carbonic anhydrase